MITPLLIRLFIKNPALVKDPGVRKSYGFLSGFVGIVLNILLFAVKLLTGFAVNSISMIADSFNNLSDVFSSVVTMWGFALAGKPADEEHPFGHGRMEYIAGLIVSFLIILIGYEFMKSSLDRILHPAPVTFNLAALLIIVLTIFAKIWLAFFNKTLSRMINSQALSATSLDSLSDSISSGCVALSLLAAKWTSFPLDGYFGIVVAAIILYSGLSLTRETISPLLGEGNPGDLAREVTKKVLSYEDILNVHDLVIHSYGPGRYMATIHAEVPADRDIMDIHELIDQIEREVSGRLNIALTIHMDPVDTNSQELVPLREELEEILREFPQVLSYHDFRIVGKHPHHNLIFDVVVKPGLPKQEEKGLRQALSNRIRARHPHYNCIITVDQEFCSI